jgi:formylglycine-generating enzyme required for sulfatase activity
MIMPAQESRYLIDLLRRVDGLFALDEVRTISMALGIDYENVPGDTKESFVRALIRQLFHDGRLQKLVDEVRAQRPDIDWPDVPADLVLPAGSSFDQTPFQRLPYEPETARIPAGPFLMGSDQDAPAEAPRHTIELPAYAIGLYPVTNEQYAHYIHTAGRAASLALLWDGNRPPDDRLTHPVTGVTWREALDYCRWLAQTTGRPYTLPNEAQWEKAARGADGRVFPWGDEWLPDRANTSPDDTPVDAFPAQSVYGCHDMIGNAREWTLSGWGSAPQAPGPLFAYPWRADRRNDPGQPLTTRRVFRGGRYPATAGERAYRCSARGGALPDKPGLAGNRHGFRVALNPEQGPTR